MRTNKRFLVNTYWKISSLGKFDVNIGPKLTIRIKSPVLRAQNKNKIF